MPFVKGKSGNPRGRPPAIDQRATDRIRRMIVTDVQRHGIDAIQRLREKDPASYWRVVLDIMGLREPAKRAAALGINITVKEFKLSHSADGITIEHDAGDPLALTVDTSDNDDSGSQDSSS